MAVNSVPHPASAEGKDIARALRSLRNAISSAMSAAVDAMEVTTEGFLVGVSLGELGSEEDDDNVMPRTVLFSWLEYGRDDDIDDDIDDEMERGLLTL